MFYIARKTYNRPGHNLIDSDVITIRTAPAQVAGQTIVDDGNYLYFGDYAVVSHGSYETLSAARQALVDKFSAVHKIDAYAEPDVVETYNSETRLRLHHNPRLQERVHAYMRDQLVKSTQSSGWSTQPKSSDYSSIGMITDDVQDGLRIEAKKIAGEHQIISLHDSITPDITGIVTLTVDITGADDGMSLFTGIGPGGDDRHLDRALGALFEIGGDSPKVKAFSENAGKTSAVAKKRTGGITLELISDWRASFDGKYASDDLRIWIALIDPETGAQQWTPSDDKSLIIQRISAQTTAQIADDEQLGELIKKTETSINALGYTIGPDALAVALDVRDIVAAQPQTEHELPPLPPPHAVARDPNKPPKFWPTDLGGPNRSSMSPDIGWWDGVQHNVADQYSTTGVDAVTVSRYTQGGRYIEGGLQLIATPGTGMHVAWDETGPVILDNTGAAFFGAHITDVHGVPRIAISSHPENVDDERGVIYDLRTGTAQAWHWPDKHQDYQMWLAPDGSGGWWALAKFAWGSGFSGKKCRHHLWLLNETAQPRGSWKSAHYERVTASHALTARAKK